MLRKTGLADAVLRAATFDGESWVARFGRLIEKMTPGERDALATTLRAFLRVGAQLGDGKSRKC